jgi:hypothetical protein
MMAGNVKVSLKVQNRQGVTISQREIEITRDPVSGAYRFVFEASMDHVKALLVGEGSCGGPKRRSGLLSLCKQRANTTAVHFGTGRQLPFKTILE